MGVAGEVREWAVSGGGGGGGGGASGVRRCSQRGQTRAAGRKMSEGGRVAADQ